jgi:hypothetical protein
MTTQRMSPARFVLVAAFVLLALTLVPIALADKGGGGHSSTNGGGHNGGGGSTSGGSGCSISPSQVVLDQVWTVSASGLPTNSTVNRILTFPDGSTSTGPITVASDGTYTTTGSSDMSASWGFIAPEQMGTYTYQFVGKVTWPAGTFKKLYAECSVLVS